MQRRNAAGSRENVHSLLPPTTPRVLSPLIPPRAQSVQGADVCVWLPGPHLRVPSTQSLSSPFLAPVLRMRNLAPLGQEGQGAEERQVAFNQPGCVWEAAPGMRLGHRGGPCELGRLPTCPLLLDLLCMSPAHSFQSTGGHRKFSPS